MEILLGFIHLIGDHGLLTAAVVSLAVLAIYLLFLRVKHWMSFQEISLDHLDQIFQSVCDPGNSDRIVHRVELINMMKILTETVKKLSIEVDRRCVPEECPVKKNMGILIDEFDKITKKTEAVSERNLEAVRLHSKITSEQMGKLTDGLLCFTKQLLDRLANGRGPDSGGAPPDNSGPAS